MMGAYSELYLNDAMKNLGEALDYAINSLKISGDEFVELFIASGIADMFENGDPRYISGYSGTELALIVLEQCGLRMDIRDAQIDYECSAEYWCGWVLAYCQWKKEQSFREIHKSISIAQMQRMYKTYHEASEDKFVDTLTLIMENDSVSALQKQRRMCGYTQKELSEKSGVNIRTLQQYENKSKDIKKASIATVIALSKVLGCQTVDILG